MTKEIKKQAPTGAKQTTKAGKEPAYSGTPKGDYAGKPAEKGNPYAEKTAEGYDAKTIDGCKDAFYRVAEAGYQLKSQEPLSETQKRSIRGGIEGLVDAALILGKADPKLAYCLQAVLVGDAAKRYGVESEEGKHYLSQLAAQFAEKGGLKAYERPDGMKPAGGYGGMPGTAPYGGLPPDLGQMIASYFAKGQPTQGETHGYGNKP